MTPDQLEYMLLVVGLVTFAYGAFRTIRRVVHFFDALESAATDLTTLPTLVVDIKNSLHEINAIQARHEKNAERRVEKIVDGVREAMRV